MTNIEMIKTLEGRLLRKNDLFQRKGNYYNVKKFDYVVRFNV